MRKFKKIARFIMELILAIAIIAFLLIHVISKTILNEQYILSSIEKADYYSKTYELLESNFENYIQQSGLDEKILENIVTKEQIKEDTKKIIINMYDGIKEEVSIEAIKQNLEKNINEQIDTDSLSTEQKQAIDQFVKTLCDEYRATIANTNYESQINDGYKKISKYIKLAQKASIVMIGISIIIIILLNLRRVYKIATNTGTALLASGIILTIINIYINSKIKIKYLSILNEPTSIVLRNIANDVLGKILVYGILLIISSVILLIISNFIHNIVKYKGIMENKSEEN